MIAADDLDTCDHQRLLDMRGGCRCQDPGASPPCGACTEPATDAELSELEDYRKVSEGAYKEYLEARRVLGYDLTGSGIVPSVWSKCDLSAQLNMAKQMTEAAAVHKARADQGWGSW